jgi:PAS domain S-box-containing protein
MSETSHKQKKHENHPAARLGKFFFEPANGKAKRLLPFKLALERQEHLERHTIAAIQEISADALFFVGMDKRIIWCNDSASGIFGYGKDEIVGMDASAFLPSEDKIRPVHSHIAKRVCTFIRKDGSTFPGELCGKVVNHQNGKPHFVVVSVWDTTVREKALMEQKAESTAIVGGGLAHDINNMLGAILGNVELARGNVPYSKNTQADPAKCLSYLAKAMKSIMEIRGLTQKFNDISGFTVMRDERVDLEFLMDHLFNKIKGRAEKANVKLNFMGGKDCAFLGDPIKTLEMLEIFAINAIEAMPKGGILSIKVFKSKAGSTGGSSDPLSISMCKRHLAQGTESVVITISDTGRGMDEKTKMKIFDPYFSTKDRGTQKGMGLSLAVAHSLIHIFKGDIGVISKPGKGTTFAMRFPAAGQENRNI